MAYKYCTTEFLNGKPLTITEIREKHPGAGRRGFNDVTIYGVVDGEQFRHAFPSNSRPAAEALSHQSEVPIQAMITKRGRYVDFEVLSR